MIHSIGRHHKDQEKTWSNYRIKTCRFIAETLSSNLYQFDRNANSKQIWWTFDGILSNFYTLTL